MTAEAWIAILVALLGLAAIMIVKLEARCKGLKTRISELEAELDLWETEAAEIEDEGEEERFSQDLHATIERENERTARRIVDGLDGEGVLLTDDESLATAAALVLRELRNAWKPDGEAVDVRT